MTITARGFFGCIFSAAVIARPDAALDIGVATTLRTQPSTRVSGAMLSLVLEF